MTVLEWREPPGRAGVVFDAETVAELRERPGEWALIRVYGSHPSCRPKTPAGVECRFRYRSIGGGRFAELYARWVGGRP